MDDEHRRTDKEIAKIERKLGSVYSQASQEAQKRYERFMGKFARLDEVKRQQVEKGEMSEEEYLTWRRNKIAMSQNYKDMVDVLTNDMVNANQIAASIVSEHLPEVYASNFNYATYQIEHDAKVDTSFTLYDRFTVEKLIRDNPDIIPIKPKVDVPRDRLWNKQKINGAVTQSILQGESIPDASKRLKSVAEMNNTAAVRTARTAITAAESSGRVDSYKRAQDMGIGLRQQWLATLDSRTRHSHRILDGESIPVAKDKWHPSKFSNGLRYPGDPQGPGHEIYNCRCTLIADVEGVDQGAIDDLSLRNNSKLGDMSYEEWKSYHQERLNKKKPNQAPSVLKLDKSKYNYPIQVKRKSDKEVINEWEKMVNSQTFNKRDLNLVNEKYFGTLNSSNITSALRENPTKDIADIGASEFGIFKGKENKEVAFAMERLIDSNTLDSDMILSRREGYGFITKVLGLDEETINSIVKNYDSEASQKTLNQYIGMKHTDGGFLSTSGTDSKKWAYSREGVRLELYTPKGTKAFIGNPSELEVMLDRNTTYQILEHRLERNTKGKPTDIVFTCLVLN